jgi:hypothetical protein
LNSHFRCGGAPYNEGVIRFTVILLLAMLASWPAYARAQQVVPVANTPVIRMQMRSGSLTIHTWDRQDVQIESSVPVRWRHFEPQAVANALPPEVTIPSTAIMTPNGPVILPAETFAIGSVLSTPHDGVVIFGGAEGADVTLTIPASTALVWAVIGRGSIAVDGYRGGTFVATLHNGPLQLQNTGGDVYAQVARGPIFINNSAFNRIRVRTAAGNIVFQDSNVRQIEASTVNGSIAYDNGTFVPGIARFESQNGNVAIGIAGGGARIDAHSDGGRIFSGFSGGASVSGSPTDAQALVGAGGPVITVNSQRGGVYLYNGSLRTHGRLQGPWDAIGRMLRRPSEQKLPHRRHI